VHNAQRRPERDASAERCGGEWRGGAIWAEAEQRSKWRGGAGEQPPADPRAAVHPCASNQLLVFPLSFVHLEATGALDVHEEAVGSLYQALELVQLRLVLGRGVQQVVIDLRETEGRSSERTAIASVSMQRLSQRAASIRALAEVEERCSSMMALLVRCAAPTAAAA